jgi:predicted RNase H-like nuclease
MTDSLSTPAFFGLDLAWSPRNPSGGALLRAGRLMAVTGDLGDDDAIIRWIGAHLSEGGAAVVAVDAPLRVPNQTGSRPCDRALSAEWRRFEAGALPANRRLLARDGQVRGEALVALLAEAHGFAEQTSIPHRERILPADWRIVCEVYPHPAHVSLFDLPVTLKYKARRRSYAERWAAFEEYAARLKSLEQAEPPLGGITELLDRVEIRTLRGRALKEFEDRLDAVTCAYVAAYLWHHGPTHSRVYGSLEEGHILVPVTPHMARRLEGRAPI